MCHTDLIPKVMTMSDILLIIAHFTFNTDRIIKRLNIFASIFQYDSFCILSTSAVDNVYVNLQMWT